jgi:hypothetical protein
MSMKSQPSVYSVTSSFFQCSDARILGAAARGAALEREELETTLLKNAARMRAFRTDTGIDGYSIQVY